MKRTPTYYRFDNTETDSHIIPQSLVQHDKHKGRLIRTMRTWQLIMKHKNSGHKAGLSMGPDQLQQKKTSYH